MTKRRHDESGMTLLELMFASGILTSVFAMLFTSMMSLAVIRRAAETRQTALVHLATVLEELRGASVDELLTYAPPAFDGVEDVQSVQVECLDDAGSAIRLPVDTGSLDSISRALPNPVEVRVTVQWNNDWGPPFVVSASAMYGR